MNQNRIKFLFSVDLKRFVSHVSSLQKLFRKRQIDETFGFIQEICLLMIAETWQCLQYLVSNRICVPSMIMKSDFNAEECLEKIHFILQDVSRDLFIAFAWFCFKTRALSINWFQQKLQIIPESPQLENSTIFFIWINFL